MVIEKLEKQQMMLIKALLKEKRKNNLLEARNALYTAFLTKEQIKAADEYALQLAKRGDEN